MTDGIYLNPATSALLGAVWLVLSGVIVALYRLLIGRLTRAESQVDTGLGSLEKLADSIDLAGKGITSLSTDMTAMKGQHDAILEKLTTLERRRGT